MWDFFTKRSTYIFPIIAIVVSLFAGLPLTITSIIVLGILLSFCAPASIYFYTCILEQENKLTEKDKEHEKELEEKDKQIEQLNQKIRANEEFIHKRELFKKHELPKIINLLYEFRGEVRFIYKGDKHRQLREHTEQVKDGTEKIIEKEMRDFDDDRFNLQSNSDNR